MHAGQDIQLKGAQINNTLGTTNITAGNHIEIGAIRTEKTTHTEQDANNYVHQSQLKDVGSAITSQGNLVIQGKDIQLVGSHLNSQAGTTGLLAKNDIEIKEGRELNTFNESHKISSHGFLSSKSELNVTDRFSDKTIESTVEGNNVLLDATNIHLQGSQVVADQLVNINAKENLSIVGAQDLYRDHTLNETKKSGFLSTGGGIGFSVGSKKEKTTLDDTSILNHGSTVGSLGGDITLNVGKNYQQIGSQITAPKGDINITAQNIQVDAALEKVSSAYRHEVEQKALTLAVDVPVVSGAIQTAKNLGEDIKQTQAGQHTRVQAMAAINSGVEGYKTAQNLKDLSQLKNPSDLKVGVSLTYGEQRSLETNDRQSTTAQSSQILGGGQVHLQALGDPTSSIRVNGSDIMGQQGTRLTAIKDIDVGAAKQNSTEQSRNKSTGWGAGVAASISKDGASYGITANVNLGQGKGNGEKTSYLNSHIGSDNSLTELQSGATTTVQGGQIQGSGVQIQAKDLKLASLQDTSDYSSKQTNVSAQGTVGAGTSASGSFSHSDIHSHYASVQEQTGIYTGDAGYQIQVKNNTDLTGAVITSSQSAEDQNHNRLQTGTLTHRDLENVAQYQGTSIGISGGFEKNNQPSANSSQASTSTNTAPKKESSVTPSKSMGAGFDSDTQRSTTHSGINTKNITITDEVGQQILTGKTVDETKRDLYTDVTTETAAAQSGALKNNFDKNQVQSDLDSQVAVSKRFDENRQFVKGEVYKYVDTQRSEAKEIRKNTSINGKNGYNTAESLALEENATKWEKRAFYIDSALGAFNGLSSGSTALLGYTGAAVVSDPIRRVMTAPAQRWKVQCNGDALYCSDSNLDKSKRSSENGKAEIGSKRQIFNDNDIKPNPETGVITISNNGIMNPSDDALKNAVKQNLWSTDKEGVIVVYNPPTTNPISELLYAAYDKTNDLLGGRLPLTSAEKANIELYKYAKQGNYLLDVSNHSRGGLTASVAIQNANRNGLTGVPLNKVRFYGTATNVQDFSNWIYENNHFINPITGNSTGVYSAVHATDFVGRPSIILGGNPSTGGNCWLCYSHSSYSAEIPSKYLMNEKGQYIDKQGAVVSENDRTPNTYYAEYIEKWGTSSPQNLSLPILVPSNKAKDVVKYEKNPF